VAERLWAPVDAGALVLFRFVLGVLLAVEAYRQWANGWIASSFVEPSFHFSFDGFAWVKPLPLPWMTAFFAGLGVLGVLLAFGVARRVMAFLSLLGWAYVFLIDLALYLNHLYLVLLLLAVMTVVPLRRNVQTVPAWALGLLRFQLAVPYLFGGIAKLNGDWLRGEPMRRWLESTAFDAEWQAMLASYGGLLLDLFVVPALLWRRTRWFALAVAMAFHLTNAWLFQIGIFPWLMIFGTLMFLPAKTFALFSGSGELRGPEVPKRPRLVMGLLAAWAVFHVAVPLRHWVYPGDVAWTEEGQLFAWRMKLTQKDNQTAFLVIFKSDGKHWEVPLEQFLTRRQEDKMAGDPAMIRKFARHLRATLGDVEVYASTRTALNEHPAAPLVDPRVDLAADPLPDGWILPRQN